MVNSSLGELYFIIGMMALILVICAVATYVFFRQYKREKDIEGNNPDTAPNEEDQTA